MTDQPDMFPEIAARQSTPPKPCTAPYFLVAYWPRGQYWSILSRLFVDRYSADIEADRMKDRGWNHVTIMKLPEALWEPKP